MWSDLLPLNLSQAARRLGVEPFDLVRLLVATDGMPKELAFSPEQVDALGAKGGIEPSWWPGVDLPEDHNPMRQRVRAALGLLLERGHVGGEGTRLDNVWRGLPSADQALVRDALHALSDEGLVAMLPGKICTRVLVNAASEERVREIAEGRSDTSALSALYE